MCENYSRERLHGVHKSCKLLLAVAALAPRRVRVRDTNGITPVKATSRRPTVGKYKNEKRERLHNARVDRPAERPADLMVTRIRVS